MIQRHRWINNRQCTSRNNFLLFSPGSALAQNFSSLQQLSSTLTHPSSLIFSMLSLRPSLGWGDGQRRLEFGCNGFSLPLLSSYSLSAECPSAHPELTYDWTPSGVSLPRHGPPMVTVPSEPPQSQSTPFQEWNSSSVPSKRPLLPLSFCVSSDVSSCKSSGELTGISCLCQLPPFLGHI